MENAQEALRQVHGTLMKLRKDFPKQTGTFLQFIEQVAEEGFLDTKTKELVSVALAVAEHCHWCIAFHVSSALRAGASREEILEAAFVAVSMAGGPALMYITYVLNALANFEQKEQKVP